jgi:hypothetical protein
MCFKIYNNKGMLSMLWEIIPCSTIAFGTVLQHCVAGICQLSLTVGLPDMEGPGQGSDT